MSWRRSRVVAFAALAVATVALGLRVAPTEPPEPASAAPTRASAAPLASLPPLEPFTPPARVAVPHRAPLQRGAFGLLPLGATTPRGWLRRQLELQAAGLGGHLDEIWTDVGENGGWLGGNGESWERGPYFLDGLLPLAHLLDDAALKKKVARWVEWTLTHQRVDGGIGPERNTDWWPNMVMLKVLTQHHEATGDPRVLTVMARYFAHQAAALADRPLTQWALYRWQDEVLSVLWLYDRTGDAALLDLARRLAKEGFDWKKHFAAFAYTGKVAKADAMLNTHVVNNAMALKSAGVQWLVTGDPDDRAAVARQLDAMDHHHLLPSGVHSCGFVARQPISGFTAFKGPPKGEVK